MEQSRKYGTERTQILWFRSFPGYRRAASDRHNNSIRHNNVGADEEKALRVSRAVNMVDGLPRAYKFSRLLT